MNSFAEQGDIIWLPEEKKMALVISKNFFNETGLAVVCPVIRRAAADALHLPIRVGNEEGVVLCEHLKTMDLNKRYYQKRDSIPYALLQEAVDMVQAIFDYYPFG